MAHLSESRDVVFVKSKATIPPSCIPPVVCKTVLYKWKFKSSWNDLCNSKCPLVSKFYFDLYVFSWLLGKFHFSIILNGTYRFDDLDEILVYV